MGTKQRHLISPLTLYIYIYIHMFKPLIGTFGFRFGPPPAGAFLAVRLGLFRRRPWSSSWAPRRRADATRGRVGGIRRRVLGLESVLLGGWVVGGGVNEKFRLWAIRK